MTQEEISEALAAHELWLGREPGGKRMVAVNADMRGAYMHGASLGGVKLRGTQLRGAYMSYADINEADMTEADMTGAYMLWTKLRGVCMSRAKLCRADMTHADLTCADVTGADISTANFQGANLHGVKWTPGLALCGRAHRGDYEFFAWLGAWPGAEPVIRAGCRTWIGLADARAYYRTMEGTDKAEHSLAILDYLETRVDAQRKQWSRNNDPTL